MWTYFAVQAGLMKRFLQNLPKTVSGARSRGWADTQTG
jgi:hypothetical protein